MTNAEKTKALTESYYNEKREAKKKRSEEFARKIVLNKVNKRAIKGYYFCKVKIKRSCSALIVGDTLVEMGYSITKHYGFFGASILIKW